MYHVFVSNLYCPLPGSGFKNIFCLYGALSTWQIACSKSGYPITAVLLFTILYGLYFSLLEAVTPNEWFIWFRILSIYFQTSASMSLSCQFWLVCLLFYARATVLQLYHGSDMMYEMRWRKPKHTLLLTQRIFNLSHHRHGMRESGLWWHCQL